MCLEEQRRWKFCQLASGTRPDLWLNCRTFGLSNSWSEILWIGSMERGQEKRQKGWNNWCSCKSGKLEGRCHRTAPTLGAWCLSLMQASPIQSNREGKGSPRGIKRGQLMVIQSTWETRTAPSPAKSYCFATTPAWNLGSIVSLGAATQ